MGQQWRGQFLEAYFVINLAYARLVALRKSYRRVPRQLENSALRALEEAIQAREKLEDQAAPYGLIASPVYQDGFTIDVRFSDVQTARAQAAPALTSSASVLLKILVPSPRTARPCKS